MTYTLSNSDYVVRDIDSAFIPNDETNSDWREYQEWLLVPENTPNPIPTPSVVIPHTVSDRQFFQAATLLGLISETDALSMVTVGIIPPTLLAAILALPAPLQFSAKMKIIGARAFDRNDPLVLALSATMGQTPDQVDALFILADSL